MPKDLIPMPPPRWRLYLIITSLTNAKYELRISETAKTD